MFLLSDLQGWSSRHDSAVTAHAKLMLLMCMLATATSPLCSLASTAVKT